MDSVILKDLRVRGVLAAGALLIAAACGGDDESAASPAPARDSASFGAAPAARQAPVPQQPAAPAPAILDSAMTPAEAAAVAKATAGPAGPVTVEALEEYDLSLPRLQKLVQAGKNLGELQRQRPDLRDSMRISAMDFNLLYQRLQSIPAARDAVTRAGVSPEEYAVATAALIQATMVTEMRRQGRTPQGAFNERNAQFVSENWEEIQRITRAAAPRPSAPQQSN